MLERDYPDPVAQVPATVPAVVGDDPRQQDAWRLHQVDLAHLRADVLATAEREAAAIVTSARADVRSIIVAARRELLALAVQIKTLPHTQDEWHPRQGRLPGLSGTSQPEPTAGNIPLPAEDSVRAAGRLLDARQNLLHVMGEARGDLEHLRDEALAGRLLAEPTAVSEPDLHENTSLPTGDEPVPAAEPLIAEVGDQGRPKSPAMVLAIAATLIGLALLLGLFWWDRIGHAMFARPKPAVQAAPRSAPSEIAERPANGTAPSADPIEATIRPSLEPIATERPRPSDTAGSIATAGARESGNHPASRIESAGLPSAVGKAALPAAATPSLVTTADSARPVTSVPTPVAETTPESRAELTSAAEQWLDAYCQHDSSRMALVGTPDLKVSDQRASGEKPAPGVENVRGALEQAKLQFAGTGAILTARMIEQTGAADQPGRYLSWISQVWLREAGRWRLMEVRIISDAKLK